MFLIYNDNASYCQGEKIGNSHQTSPFWCDLVRNKNGPIETVIREVMITGVEFNQLKHICYRHIH